MPVRPGRPARCDKLRFSGPRLPLAPTNAHARDPGLAGARGQVRAKTGTFVQGTAQGPVLRTQALAGYIVAKSGRRLAFTLAVNEVGVIAGLAGVMAVFQDEGTIAAMLWRTY
jgi:D-alanyl-D-alanine carboxypeptidase/D-alanyl-D-alanine-endopeptidase (penicillin-binding protein 4)